MNGIEIREMRIEDYDFVIKLWADTEGIGLSEADSRENITIYLQRNPGLSFIAQKNSEVVGAILCGHDGRRGYLHHLAVKKDYRLKGLGKELVQNCLLRLKVAGIDKCHIFVFQENKEGMKFWDSNGWQIRHDLHIMSKPTLN